jgi:hypothetical protein
VQKDSLNGFLEEHAGRALRDARIRAELMHKISEFYNKRAVAQNQQFSWRERRCPICNDDLRLRHMNGNQTIFICPSCSFSNVQNFQMDEARLPHEAYRPRITGVPKGHTVVRMQGSKIVEIVSR